ncbi:hypothetical protein B0T14DRAFT_592552 [Immersiella caudata]|uniref:Uncharacterized protein n=1 Tax=Immersiella caudata TaxID=314043 RepID=A0AA39WF75_9PEZI|nr:hypothetical protein B0T14DRAFT_592552 [Immersiella caudata]
MAPSMRVVSAPPGHPTHGLTPIVSPSPGTAYGPTSGPPPGQPVFVPVPDPSHGLPMSVPMQNGQPMPFPAQGHQVPVPNPEQAAPKRRGRPLKAGPQPTPQVHPLYQPGAPPQNQPHPHQQHPQQPQPPRHQPPQHQPPQHHPPQQPPQPHMIGPAPGPVRGSPKPPPQPMPAPPPPSQVPNAAPITKRPPVPFPPLYLPVPKGRRPDPPVDPTRLPLIPPFLAVAPAICKPREDVFSLPPPDTFSFGMHTVALDSPGHVALWKDQVEPMARACGCYRELTTRFGVFPKGLTVEAAVIKFRYQTCWSILSETISGPVWAYMRILGYNRIPIFKDMDGIQLHLPGSPHQNRAEVPCMVEEVRSAKREDYPTEEHSKKGIEWMRNILDNMIRIGDRQVCESLYDAHPPFAPQCRMDLPYEGPWRLKGEPLLAIPKRDFRLPADKNMRLAREKHEAELAQAESDAKVTMEEYKR